MAYYLASEKIRTRILFFSSEFQFDGEISTIERSAIQVDFSLATRSGRIGDRPCPIPSILAEPYVCYHARYTSNMAALLIASVVTIIASFGAAYLGALLQRKWTPNPVPSIEKLGGRIEELRERMGAIERERLECENFTLGIWLRQTNLSLWIVEVKNETDKDVYVDTIQFFRGDDTPLSRPEKPKEPDDWRIPGHSQKQLLWSPQDNPIMTLKFSEPQHGVALPYRFVLGCRSDRKPRTAQRKLLLVYRDNTLTQYGP